MNIEGLRRNLRLLLAFKLASFFFVYLPVSLAYYQEIGLNLAQINALQSLSWGMLILTEIPTGALADRFGHRQALIVGALLHVLAFCVLTVTYSFVWVVVAHVLLGLGISFVRGADSALARESTDRLGEKTEKQPYFKFERRGVFFAGLGEGAAALAALALVLGLDENGPRAAMGVQVISSIVLLILAVLTTEARQLPKASLGGFKVSLAEHWRTTRTNLVAAYRNKHVRWLAVYGAVIGCTTQTMVWLTLPYFQSLGLTPLWYAALWAGYHFVYAGLSFTVDAYENVFGRSGALTSLVGWGAVAYIALMVLPGYWGLLMLLAFFFIRAVQLPIVRDYLTKEVKGDYATALSVLSTVQLTLFVIMNSVLGIVMEQYSVYAAFGVSLVVYGLLGLLSATRLRYHALRS